MLRHARRVTLSTGRLVKALCECGARQVAYTEYPDGEHSVWDRAYAPPKFFERMPDQRLAGADSVP